MNIRENWKTLIWVIGVLAFSFTIPVLAWRGDMNTERLIQVATLVLSWPVAILIIGLAFISRFDGAIDQLLRSGLRTTPLPGGLNPQGEQALSSESVSLGSNKLPSAERQKQIEDQFHELVVQAHLSDKERKEMESLYKSVSQAGQFWKYQYLNLFLAPTTRKVLYWFSQVAGQTISRTQFHTAWKNTIVDSNQRDVIVNVLIENGLLSQSGKTLRITPEGNLFLQFMGL